MHKLILISTFLLAFNKLCCFAQASTNPLENMDTTYMIALEMAITGCPINFETI